MGEGRSGTPGREPAAQAGPPGNAGDAPAWAGARKSGPALPGALGPAVTHFLSGTAPRPLAPYTDLAVAAPPGARCVPGAASLPRSGVPPRPRAPFIHPLRAAPPPRQSPPASRCRDQSAPRGAAAPFAEEATWRR